MGNGHSAFVGNIPDYYDKYLGPLIFSQYAKDLAERINLSPGGVLLETAAGTGMATRQLRDVIDKNIHIVATDLNEDMLHIAKSKFRLDEDIEFKVANAMELPFEDSSFEAVVCQFSLMFFPDKLASLRETCRVLKPGGKYYFNIWDSFEHNELINTLNNALSNALAEDPPDFFNTPYGYFEIDVVKNLLIEAGFSQIDVSVSPLLSRSPSARDVALGYLMGTPVRLQIEQRAPALLPDLIDTVEHEIGEKHGYKDISAKMQALVFTAQSG